MSAPTRLLLAALPFLLAADSPTCVAFSADGKWLVRGGNDGVVSVWDVATGQELHADGDSFPDTALLAAAPGGMSLFVVTGHGGRVGEEAKGALARPRR